jgi:FtsZ-binding cell division protein ZapB
MLEKQEQCARDEIAALNAQIEQLKQAILMLQGQLADMRGQRDKWQSRAERVSLVAAY